MDYVKLGSTGLEVSRICLGCMSFGEPLRGAHPWSIGPDKARPIIRQALDAGINFLDTANVYSDGSSEEIVGQALSDFTHRAEIVLATKVNGRMRAGANGAGLSVSYTHLDVYKRQDLVQDIVAELVEVGAAVRSLEGHVVGDDRDVVGAVRGYESIKVCAVGDLSLIHI